MPLHDWAELSGWDGLHDIWIVELLRHIQPRLPEGYRAYIGSPPGLTIGAPNGKPDVAVRHWMPEPPPPLPATAADPGVAFPAEEVVTLTLDPQTAVFVSHENRLIAVIELISPSNKDRPASRTTYVGRYLGYLHEEAHLLLVDVHHQPLGFSFADALNAELNLHQPPCPAPQAVSYRVGAEAPQGGRFVACRTERLAIGQPLPTMPLALSVEAHLNIDLESTYSRAAADLYLS